MKYSTIVALLLSGCASLRTDIAPQLSVEQIRVKTERRVFFDGDNIPPPGTKIGDFAVVSYTRRFVTNPATMGRKDVSELTLRRGDKTITLPRGTRRAVWLEFAHLRHTRTGEQYTLSPGDEFQVDGRQLVLRAVDDSRQECMVVDTKTGKTFAITKNLDRVQSQLDSIMLPPFAFTNKTIHEALAILTAKAQDHSRGKGSPEIRFDGEDRSEGKMSLTITNTCCLRNAVDVLVAAGGYDIRIETNAVVLGPMMETD